MTPQPETNIQKVLDGLIDRAELARQMRCTDRTIIRYERAGMPFIAVGKFRFYKPEDIRAWVMSHEHRPQTPQRGRPRKLAA